MYFEEEYIQIIKEKLRLFLKLHDWSFHSKEDMLEKFNSHEDLNVTIKTFNKWMDGCKFKVEDCIIIKDENPPTFDTTRTIKPPTPLSVPSEEEGEEAFDNEQLEDWYPHGLVTDHTKSQERNDNG